MRILTMSCALLFAGTAFAGADKQVTRFERNTERAIHFNTHLANTSRAAGSAGVTPIFEKRVEAERASLAPTPKNIVSRDSNYAMHTAAALVDQHNPWSAPHIANDLARTAMAKSKQLNRELPVYLALERQGKLSAGDPSGTTKIEEAREARAAVRAAVGFQKAVKVEAKRFLSVFNSEGAPKDMEHHKKMWAKAAAPRSRR